MNAQDLMVPILDSLVPDNSLKEAVNILRTAARSVDKFAVTQAMLDESCRIR